MRTLYIVSMPRPSHHCGYSKISVITPVPTVLLPSLRVNLWLISSGRSNRKVSVRGVSSPGITISLPAWGRGRERGAGKEGQKKEGREGQRGGWIKERREEGSKNVEGDCFYCTDRNREGKKITRGIEVRTSIMVCICMCVRVHVYVYLFTYGHKLVCVHRQR